MRTFVFVIMMLGALPMASGRTPDFAEDAFTLSAWIKTTGNGTLVSKCAPEGRWSRGGKALFLRDGVLVYDIGWVGAVRGRARIDDNQWHHVALTGAMPQRGYVDGRLDMEGDLTPLPDQASHVLKSGYTSPDFGGAYQGLIDELAVYNRVLTADEIAALASGKGADLPGLVSRWAFENNDKDSVGKTPLRLAAAVAYDTGKVGMALKLAGPARRNTREQKTAKKQDEGQPQMSPVKYTKFSAGNFPQIDFDRIVFVNRLTYSANHYYTEYINSRWTPGGNLCVFDMKTQNTWDLVPELEDGVFGRFDVSFDATSIVFAWKCAPDQGYRIFEIDIDPKTGRRVGQLRQLTFPEDNEDWIVENYRVGYHHGTDDMDPCYLPDGGICFISSRCQYGILCDAPDIFTTTVLYRMDRDGKNMRKLSNSSVSEAAPTILPDGRIMYTRWEYLDKGAVSVKCLWAMKPDGTSSEEIYGNDISLPPTMIYGRPIPNRPNQYVVLGTPHCPQNGMGTVIRLDMDKNIRTREPMTYMTPYVDIKAEGGFSFAVGSGWKGDRSGKSGPLFKEPYPLSDKLFLVPHKAAAYDWADPKAYDICLLEESGNVSLIYDDPEMSCFQPFPLKPRKKPPVIGSPLNPMMAEKNLATCVVTDIYHGMETVHRGPIKFIRVLEQVPRPWATRRRWGGDVYDQQHACITKDTHLGLKVQHGIVPVEPDGSAHFVVPAGKNIFFQVLDENYMALQTERTYVNYIAGETRSCIGCHETPKDVATARTEGSVLALRRKPSVPGPQPGETSGKRPLDYETDVQPVFDRYCIQCHKEGKLEGDLNLTGHRTDLFCVSYEQLVPPRRGGLGRRNRPPMIGPTIGENHPKTGNVHYMPARSFGSHNSILVAMLAPDKVKLDDPKQAEMAARLAEEHKDLKIKPEDLLKITNWVDTNAQYYGMYWGRKNLQYKDHPNFRPVPTFERAASYVSQIPEKER